MLNISIPKPCHEDWDNMSPNRQGRHCNSCMKTVVDFSIMTDDEVKNFLISRKEEQLCGRFSGRQLRTIQIELPQNIFNIEMSWRKKFLLACLVVFSTTLFSCEIKHADKGTPVTGKTLKETGKTDGLSDEPRYVGGLVLHWDTTYTPEPTTIQLPEVDTVYTDNWMGDISFQTADTTVPMVIPDCKLPDSIFPKQPERFMKGEVMLIPDSLNIPPKKDPPKADSLKCGDFS